LLHFLLTFCIFNEKPQDSIDFTDNDIQVLGNFPLSPRIRTLLLARNRVSVIQPALPTAIPNLRNLVLASNQLTDLTDLDVLGKFARLTHLVLMDNPVTKKEVRSTTAVLLPVCEC
jgi:U2 small nuclear ribonucleoprotein A'